MTAPVPFLIGERVYLRALTEEDARGAYSTWFNDEEVCQGNSHHIFPYTFDAALDYVRYANQTRESLILAIVLHEKDLHIGNIALQNIHPYFRSAEFSILIGDKTMWGKGYAREAGKLICAHGFATLNLHRIACGTFDDNLAMKQLALSFGMREEGRRREAVFKRGRYVDMVEYGVLKDEYEAYWHQRP